MEASVNDIKNHQHRLESPAPSTPAWLTFVDTLGTPLPAPEPMAPALQTLRSVDVMLDVVVRAIPAELEEELF